VCWGSIHREKTNDLTKLVLGCMFGGGARNEFDMADWKTRKRRTYF
jgi:hypothetical protein